MVFSSVKSLLQQYSVRQGLVAGLSVLLSYVFGHYLWPDQTMWLVLAALLVMHTSRSAVLSQALLVITLAVAAVLLAYMLPCWLNIYLVFGINIIIALIVVIALTARRPMSVKNTYFIALFPVVFIIAQAFLLDDTWQCRDRAIALCLGGLIALICRYVFLPTNLYQEFKVGFLPVLNALIDYSRTISTVVNDGQLEHTQLHRAKIQLENALQERNGYPEWVYEFGFNPGLRSGYRYFLINLERVIDLYFAVGYLFRSELLRDDLQGILTELRSVLEKNTQLIQIIVEYFSSGEYVDLGADFVSDMTALENMVRELIPLHLDLLDISPNYLLLTALVRDVKDVRYVLLQLLLTVVKK